MSKIKLGYISILSVLIGATGNSIAPLKAATPTFDIPSATTETRSLHIAQAGACRQTGRTERVYSAADLASERITDIVAETRVTLASEVNQPEFGWVGISYPYSGYILATFLTPCESVAVGADAAVNNCGVVTTEFLSLRTGPSTLSGYIGRDLLQGQEFRIAERQVQTEPAAENGRVWVRIDGVETAGWIPETGAQGAGNNFRRVSCDSIDLP